MNEPNATHGNGADQLVSQSAVQRSPAQHQAQVDGQLRQIVDMLAGMTALHEERADAGRKPRGERYNPRCPECDAPTTCQETPPPAKKGGGFRRRRTYTCTAHPGNKRHRLNTDEKYALGEPMLHIKSDGRKVPFEFESLVEGLARAATPDEKPTLVYQVAKAVGLEVAKDAKARWDKGSRSQKASDPLPVTSSAEVGEKVLAVLKGKRLLAMWLRFALIHKKADKDAMDKHVTNMKIILDKLWEEWGDTPAWKEEDQ